MAADVSVSVRIAGVSLRSALVLMLDSLELDYVIQNEVLMITTKEVAQQKLSRRVYRIADSLDPEELIQLITNMVAVDTWQEVGGTAAISTLNNEHLVIAQTEQIHDQIADFIEQLCAATAKVAGTLRVPW